MHVSKNIRFLGFASLICFSCVAAQPDPGESCGLKLPRPMRIDRFISKVADGEDWVELLFMECPQGSPEASITKFRAKYSVDGNLLNRSRNFRIDGSCAGTKSNVYEQVGSSRAIFESTNSAGGNGDLSVVYTSVLLLSVPWMF